LDPLFRGSWSYIPTGSSGSAIDRLAAPVTMNGQELGQEETEEAAGGGRGKQQQRRPVLRFAGETTHRGWYGTAHGAYASGVREAQALLPVLGCGGT